MFETLILTPTTSNELQMLDRLTTLLKLDRLWGTYEGDEKLIYTFSRILRWKGSFERYEQRKENNTVIHTPGSRQ
jgi:hypothetical protein